VASSGAHTLGGIRSKALSFDFTTNSYSFDNGYFKLVLEFWEAGASGFEWFVRLPLSRNGYPAVALLPSDILLGDPRNADLRTLVELYANDQERWFVDFSAFICSLKGVGKPEALVTPV
jgi:hypothetical protein